MEIDGKRGEFGVSIVFQDVRNIALRSAWNRDKSCEIILKAFVFDFERRFFIDFILFVLHFGFRWLADSCAEYSDSWWLVGTRFLVKRRSWNVRAMCDQQCRPRQTVAWRSWRSCIALLFFDVFASVLIRADTCWYVMIRDDTWWYVMIRDDAWWWCWWWWWCWCWCWCVMMMMMMMMLMLMLMLMLMRDDDDDDDDVDVDADADAWWWWWWWWWW